MSYFFNGTTGLVANGTYLDPRPVNLTVAYPFLMCCWFFPTDNSTDQDLVMLQNTNTNDAYWLSIAGTVANDPIRAITWNGTSAQNASIASSIKFSQWNFAAARFLSNTARSVSINGSAFTGTATDSTQTSSYINTIAIGSAQTGTLRPFNGYIAHVAIYNGVNATTSLQDVDMASLGRGISPLSVRRQNLVAYWPMVNPGPIVNVASAKSRDRTILYNTSGVRYSNWNPPVKTILPIKTRIVVSQFQQNKSPIFYHQRQQQGMAS